MKLAGEKTTLKLAFNNITTRELNIESLESSLNSILNGVNDIELISNFKSEVIKQYTGENSLVLFKKNSENRLTDSLKKADETIKEIKQKYEELPEDLKHLKALAIMDKCDSVNGYAAPLFTELTSAMYSKGLNVPTIDYIYGLGGVDVRVEDIISIFNKLNEIAKNGKVEKTTYYLGYDD